MSSTISWASAAPSSHSLGSGPGATKSSLGHAIWRQVARMAPGVSASMWGRTPMKLASVSWRRSSAWMTVSAVATLTKGRTSGL